MSLISGISMSVILEWVMGYDSSIVNSRVSSLIVRMWIVRVCCGLCVVLV